MAVYFFESYSSHLWSIYGESSASQSCWVRSLCRP
jgi:hypothetical protein